MLHWTAGGAVAAPETLQVRVTARYPGRVPAGAPVPTRTLDDDEVRASVRHFTVERRGPRTRPCRALVLAGVDLAGRHGLADVLSEARGWGVERVVLHLGRGDRGALAASPVARNIDAVAISVADAGDLADLGALSRTLDVTAVVRLDDATLPRLGGLARGLAAIRPARVVLTWPFPGDVEPPHADRVAAALPEPVAALDAAGVACGIKGLPACRLGALSTRLWRSGNRWYVDADHQREHALLFFPDVVRFGRTEECRFCAVNDRCDGAPEAWLRKGLAGILRAID